MSQAVLEAKTLQMQSPSAVLGQVQREASAGTGSALQRMPTPVSTEQVLGDTNTSVVTSQDLSVARMMMTLAQASNCNTDTLEAGNNPPKKPSS